MTKANNKRAPIAMRAVSSSSSVKRVGYDPDTKTLAVEFSSDQIYHYHDVSQDRYDELTKAKSFGKQLQSTIVGKHKHTRL